jgi:branched-chain amino acid transport system ATP-binding protein
MALLEVDGIHVFYDKIEALKGISIAVEERQIVTLVGGNGAGKSTTLRAISGLLHPRQGAIRFDGRPLAGLGAHDIAAIGVVQVPEGRRIFGRLTVNENLDMGAFVRRDRRAIAEDKERMLVLFPRLRERLKQVAGTLSGGEQQMLAAARALMARPRVLLMDEPSMGLAPMLVEQVFETIRRINAQGVTILLVEQNAPMALGIADRGYVLESGRIVLDGPGRALLDDERVEAGVSRVACGARSKPGWRSDEHNRSALPRVARGMPSRSSSGRCGEHRDDLQVIAGVRERTRQQVPDLVAQLVEGGARRRQSHGAEQPLQLRKRQAPHMRRITQLLRAVPLCRLCRIIRRVHIDHDDPSTRSAHAHHLAQHVQRIEEVVHGEPRHDDVEGAIGIGQPADVAAVPGDVLDPLLGGEVSRAVQHRRRHVDAGRMLHVRGERAHHEAAAAGDIQQRIARPRRGADSTIIRSALASVTGVCCAERRRLARELIRIPLLVCRVVHLPASP